MFCVKAPRPDSGKSTLCNTLGYVYRGASLANTSAPKPNSLEWEKKLFAMARTGPTFVLFDNVEHEVESDFLAQALTAPTSQSRILGQSQTQLVFNRSMFIANGNAEFSVGLNIKRRCFWSNLESHDAPLGRKADETPWLHSPFDQFVKRNRCELLQAILTLTRAWFAAGCPPPKTPTIDSFEEWSRIVGGVLEHAEIPDFLANYDKMVLEGDSADAEWEIFLQAARWILGFETFTTKDFVLRVQWADAAKEMLPEDLQESFRKGNIHAIGKVFYKRCGIPYGETRIKLVRVGPNRDKVMTWRIELPPV